MSERNEDEERAFSALFAAEDAYCDAARELNEARAKFERAESRLEAAEHFHKLAIAK